MSLVLHAGSTNKNAFKAHIAAAYSGIQVELVENFEMGVSDETPHFLKMNPIGKVPVIETPDGPVFECNAITQYVTCLKADNPLYGSSLIEYAEEAAMSALKRALDALNTHLASNTYPVGPSVTLADIILICNLLLGFKRLITKNITSVFPHVERYFCTMVNQPNFLKIIGQVKQTESVPPIQSVKNPSQPKEPVKSKAKDEAKKEANKEVKKETEKPKGEAAEEDEGPKPKPKNPFDLLPPSKMILDERKRLYSNTKTNFREVAIKDWYSMGP